MTISEHARKLARYIASQSTAIDSQDETWLVKHIQQAINAAINDLIHQGMGEPPVSEEWLLATNELLDTPGDWSDQTVSHLYEMVRFLQARIAFLASDNQAWQDGYQRGLVVGRLAEQERGED